MRTLPVVEQAMFFAGNPINRSSNERRDPEWVQEALEAEDSRFLPVCNFEFPATDGAQSSLLWGDRSWLAGAVGPAEPILLGSFKGRAHFAFDVGDLELPLDAFGISGVGAFLGLRDLASVLSPEEAAMAAQARSVLEWHVRYPFCPGCGKRSVHRNGGSSRHCPQCKTDHFPRVDPVAIVLVVRGEQCLLGRSGRFGRNLYSALAGFVEPGESIEEAARREIKEESGIEVGKVTYIASQPWPFPYSLMIGCYGEALTETIILDEEELADARWFSKDHVRRALAGNAEDLAVPGKLAIARYLIEKWATG